VRYSDEIQTENYSLFRANMHLFLAKITTLVLRHHLETFSCPQGIKRSVFHWSENNDICLSVGDASEVARHYSEQWEMPLAAMRAGSS